MAARTVPVTRVNMIFWVLSGASTSASLGGRQAENGEPRLERTGSLAVSLTGYGLEALGGNLM